MDAGLRTVHDIFEQLQVDEQWSQWSDRGFTWWAYRNAQRVWAEEPREEEGFSLSTVHVETEVLRGMPTEALDRRAFDLLLGVAMQEASLSAFVIRDDTVMLHMCAHVHDEIQRWMSQVLQMGAVLQIVAADERDDALTSILNEGPNGFAVEPAVSAHPISGERQTPDEMLGAVDELPMRDRPWGDQDEFEQVAEILNRGGMLATTGDRALTAEIPFGPNGGPAAAGGDSHMLQAMDQDRGERLGHGLRMRLQLRRWPEIDGRQIFAPELSEMEADGLSGVHLLGSWATAPVTEATPSFTCWLPSVLHRPGLLANLVMTFGARANWVSTLIP